MNLWTRQSALEATGGAAQGGDWQALRVEIDSRRIQKGDLFVALKGERFDGHAFIVDAFSRGAVAALVSEPVANAPGPLLIVQDTLAGLEKLAAHARSRTRAKCVGVTGSVGKTSAKEMLGLALSPHGKVFVSHGNYNNHIGVPLNLANLPQDADFAVIEMGMNHAGEIANLARMTQPDVALITTVDAVHLEFFDSVEGIADAKAEIFEGMAPGGTAVLNVDNPHFARLQKSAIKRNVQRIVACGEHTKSDCRLLSYEPGACGSSVRISMYGHEHSYVLGAIGRHWGNLSLLALGVCYALGLDLDQSAKALAGFSEPAGRGGLTSIAVNGESLTLINDSYNASPSSMRAAFAKTNEVWEGTGKQGRKLAALGNMLELGKETAALHAALAEDLVRLGFDKVFTAGEHMRALHDALPQDRRGGHAASAEALLPMLIAALRKDDVLLVKGSHGSNMYTLTEALTQPAAQKEKTHAV